MRDVMYAILYYNNNYKQVCVYIYIYREREIERERERETEIHT